MNITDIDDKIIKRARQHYLFDKYSSDKKDLQTVVSDAADVLGNLTKKTKENTDPDKAPMYEKILNRLNESIENLENAIKSKNSDNIAKAQQTFISESKDPLSDWLDFKFGATVTDNAIFSALPRYWEEEFHKDMESLNVKLNKIIL